MPVSIKDVRARRNSWSGFPYPPAYVCWLSLPVISFLVLKQVNRNDGTAAEAGVDEDSRFEMARANLFNSGSGSRFTKEARDAKAADGDDSQAIPSKRNFADASYWDKRYSKGATERYDWYGTWKSQSRFTIKPHVLPFMPVNVDSILQVGCGNSRLAEELIDDGYKKVTNIDFSQTVSEQMTKQLAGISGVSFLQMDASAMSFGDNSFDAVFEKGTLDAIYAGAPEIVKTVVAEVFRVLRPGGLFVSVSTQPPQTRKALNATLPWARFQSIAINTADTGSDEGSEYHLFLMTKGA